MTARFDLTVVVVTHEGREAALRTLTTARAATGGLAVQWLVVDSGSRDGTPAAIEAAFGDLQVDRRPNIGFAAANNVALRRARGRWILLLNPDMEVAEGTFADLVRALDARPRVGVASVVQQWPDGRVQLTVRRDPSPARQLAEALWLGRLAGEEAGGARRCERETQADWLVGGFLAVRATALAEVGGLDERFFLFSEEADWCRRFRAAGWEVRHLPVMRVTHDTGRSARPDLYAQNSHSKVLYARKHLRGRWRVGVFRAALALRHALRLGALRPAGAMRPALRCRAVAEHRALRVVLGRDAPPFAPASTAAPSVSVAAPSTTTTSSGRLVEASREL